MNMVIVVVTLVIVALLFGAVEIQSYMNNRERLKAQERAAARYARVIEEEKHRYARG